MQSQSLVASSLFILLFVKIQNRLIIYDPLKLTRERKIRASVQINCLQTMSKYMKGEIGKNEVKKETETDTRDTVP